MFAQRQAVVVVYTRDCAAILDPIFFIKLCIIITIIIIIICLINEKKKQQLYIEYITFSNKYILFLFCVHRIKSDKESI
jgi:hypothetical protein